jgi:hypothetical protein
VVIKLLPQIITKKAEIILILVWGDDRFRPLLLSMSKVDGLAVIEQRGFVKQIDGRRLS